MTVTIVTATPWYTITYLDGGRIVSGLATRYTHEHAAWRGGHTEKKKKEKKGMKRRGMKKRGCRQWKRGDPSSDESVRTTYPFLSLPHSLNSDIKVIQYMVVSHQNN